MRIRNIPLCAALVALSVAIVSAQEESKRAAEQRAPLTQMAVAFDSSSKPALEATLRTTSLNGAPDAPVMNIRVVVKNVSSSFLTYVSGLVTFYDSAGVRCGEGLFKVDALAQNESAETDAPGLRITCAPASWRIVATNLLPRAAEQTVLPPAESPSSSPGANFVISIDGEEHPIQLGKPMVLNVGEKQKTITVRAAP
ncbi:MAG: hypothetical protein JWM21_754 [Acidobacteria bacterium]|nr:hypothetical protein [Acidobacteriota bacterium]